MVRAALVALVLGFLSVLILNLQLPTDINKLHAVCVSIFFLGVLVGSAALKTFLDEIKEG